VEKQWRKYKNSDFFSSGFSIDQSEGELQIVYRNSPHGVIIVAFEAITEIEMHWHGPAKKTKKKRKKPLHVKKKRTTFIFIFQIVSVCILQKLTIICGWQGYSAPARSLNIFPPSPKSTPQITVRLNRLFISFHTLKEIKIYIWFRSRWTVGRPHILLASETSFEIVCTDIHEYV
jgi:hypothetical protein